MNGEAAAARAGGSLSLTRRERLPRCRDSGQRVSEWGRGGCGPLRRLAHRRRSDWLTDVGTFPNHYLAGLPQLSYERSLPRPALASRASLFADVTACSPCLLRVSGILQYSSLRLWQLPPPGNIIYMTFKIAIILFKRLLSVSSMSISN
jgi:hypothetical protein